MSWEKSRKLPGILNNEIYHGGFVDYRHSLAGTTIPSGNVLTRLNNDASTIINTYGAEGVDMIYDAVNDQFDFTELLPGDQVNIQLDATITSSANSEVAIRLTGNAGLGTEYFKSYASEFFKGAGTRPVTKEITIYMDADQISSPAYFEAESDNGSTVTVISYRVSLLRRG